MLKEEDEDNNFTKEKNIIKTCRKTGQALNSVTGIEEQVQGMQCNFFCDAIAKMSCSRVQREKAISVKITCDTAHIFNELYSNIVKR